MASTPQIPPVNAGELYVNGLQLSMNADNTDEHINVYRGAARNSTNINDIVVQDNVVLKFDRQGLNGLDTGAPTADTLYAVYAIGSSVSVTGSGQSSSLYPAGALLSKEFSRPYMPAGYDMFRRIGAVRLDSSANIVPFVQTGNDTCRAMRYGSFFSLLINGNDTDWASIGINDDEILMPYISTNIYLSTTYTTTDLSDSFYLQPDGQPDAAYYFAGNGVIINEPYTEAVITVCDEICLFNYQLDNNAGSLSIVFRGYDDLL